MGLEIKAKYICPNDDNMPSGRAFKIYIQKGEPGGFAYRVFCFDKRFPYDFIGYHSRAALEEDWEFPPVAKQLSLF